jgi:hypothetical protein
MRAKVQLRIASCPLGKWARAPLLKSKVASYADYWHEENNVIASETSDVSQNNVTNAISMNHKEASVQNEK